MFQSMQAPLFFGLIAAFVTTVGLIAVSVRGDWSERHSGLFALAAGGMLVSLSLLHIAPEAFALSPYAPSFILGGFLGGLLLHFLIHILFPGTSNGGQTAAITPIMAVALHSFIDGIIYSVTFAASFQAGVYASISLILHEFPEGIIAFAILRRFGVDNRKSFIFAFIAAAATTPLGVIASAPFMYGLGPSTIGALFAISAGLLIYVATGPLMEPLKEETPQRSLAALSVGVAIAIAISMLPVHVHAHDGIDLEPSHAAHD